MTRARSSSCLVRLAVALALATALGCSNYYLPLGRMTVNFPGFTGDAMTESEVRARLRVPEGFAVNSFASGIPNARMMRFTEAGDMLVSSPREGKVWLLARDRNGDGTADGKRVLLDGLNRPHGLALHDGWLYVAETDAVLRVRFDAESGTVRGAPERIITGLPGGGNHWTRTIAIGPDGKLYVSIGSSCNVCIEDDPRRAAIVRYELDGSNETLYATGLRNAVGFAWQPGTGDLYATDNGRDFLGDDFPPCELDRVVEGGFYGWPYANGDRVPDPDYGAERPDLVAKSIPPVHGFGAHTAPLGMTFYDGDAFPERWRGAIFVAQHGSWNRSRKSGYQVVAVFLDEEGGAREEPFLTGFEVDDKVYGRPVDVAVGPDGALYVSDDFTGSIYRVAYGAAAPLPAASPTAGGAAGVQPGADPLAGLSPEEVERARATGRTLWEQSACAGCHEPPQAGTPSATYRPLGGLKAKYTIDSLATFLRTPQPPMPAYPFPEEQRRALAIYLLSEHP
ncbi:MAG TPA: PQQ-dependent sugar dehydrogenase [Candidatus Binatia bacterium]